MNPALHHSQRRAAHLLPTFPSAQINQSRLTQNSPKHRYPRYNLLAAAAKLFRPNATGTLAAPCTRERLTACGHDTQLNPIVASALFEIPTVALCCTLAKLFRHTYEAAASIRFVNAACHLQCYFLQRNTLHRYKRDWSRAIRPNTGTHCPTLISRKNAQGLFLLNRALCYRQQAMLDAPPRKQTTPPVHIEPLFLHNLPTIRTAVVQSELSCNACVLLESDARQRSYYFASKPSRRIVPRISLDSLHSSS